MICTDRIARAQALALKSGLQDTGEAMGDFDEAAECSLISCARGVDQDAALDRLSGKTRKEVYTFLQGAGRVTAVDRDLGHERMSQAVRHYIFRPFSFIKNVRADRHASGTLSLHPSC